MYLQYSFGDPLPTEKPEWRDLLVRWGLFGGVNCWGGVVTSLVLLGTAIAIISAGQTEAKSKK